MKEIKNPLSNEKRASLISGAHLLQEKELVYSGKHVLLDLISHKFAKETDLMEKILEESINVTGAKILAKNFHSFPGGGFTGVFVLSESHLSVHTWTEIGLITIDSYMCGLCDPVVSAKYIIDKIKPEKYTIKVFKRGTIGKRDFKKLFMAEAENL